MFGKKNRDVDGFPCIDESYPAAALWFRRAYYSGALDKLYAGKK
jgi:hypothetical protein